MKPEGKKSIGGPPTAMRIKREAEEGDMQVLPEKKQREEAGHPMCEEGLLLAFQFVKHRWPAAEFQKFRRVCKQWDELITTNLDLMPRRQFPTLTIFVERDVANLDYKGVTRNWNRRKECPCYDEAKTTAEGLKGLLIFPEASYHARIAFRYLDKYVGLRNLIASRELTAGMLDMAHFFRHCRYAYFDLLVLGSNPRGGVDIAIDPQLFQLLGVLNAGHMSVDCVYDHSPQMRLMQLCDVLIDGLLQAGTVHCERFTLRGDDDILDFLSSAGKGIRRFLAQHFQEADRYRTFCGEVDIVEQIIKYFLETEKPLDDVVPNIRIYSLAARWPSMIQKCEMLPADDFNHPHIVEILKNQHSGKKFRVDLTAAPCFGYVQQIVEGAYKYPYLPTGEYRIADMELVFNC